MCVLIVTYGQRQHGHGDVQEHVTVPDYCLEWRVLDDYEFRDVEMLGEENHVINRPRPPHPTAVLPSTHLLSHFRRDVKKF